MRVLIYGINFWPELTGIGKYTGEMAQWLASNSHEVRMVTAPPYYPQWKILPGYSGTRYSREKAQNVWIQRCPLWVPKKLTIVRRIIHLSSFAISSTPVILWQAFKWKPEMIIVIQPSLFCSPAALIAARLAGARCWLHIQDSEIDALFELGSIRWPAVKKVLLFFERLLLSRFHRISTISSRMQELVKLKGITAERQTLFANWVDTTHIYPLSSPSLFRKELKFAPEDIVVLYSGNMGRKQGLELILSAAKLLTPQKHIRFVLSGDGSMRSMLVNAAKGLPNLVFLPLQPDHLLNDLLNLADIHLLIQRATVSSFCMPSKLIGMLASGHPVIATTHSDSEIARILKDCGVIVEPGNAEALVDMILYLADSPEVRVRLGLAARTTAISLWDKKMILKNFAEQMDLLVDSPA